MTKTYKVKMEDKAALLNRLEKAEVNTDSYSLTDNKLEGYFLITFDNPIDISKAQTIFKQSPNINRIKEALRKMVREHIKEKFGNAKYLS